jgi:hypothetical protein
LKFFHIPKTVESLLNLQQVRRRYRKPVFNHKPKRDICNHHPRPRPWHVGWWHLPHNYFRWQILILTKMLNGCHSRSPDRAVSELLLHLHAESLRLATRSVSAAFVRQRLHESVAA